MQNDLSENLIECMIKASGSYVHLDKIPGIIYHYTSATGLLGILENNNVKLWFTQYDSLNDKNERADATESLIRYCEEKFEQEVISSELFDIIREIKPSDLIYVSKTTPTHLELENGEIIKEMTETKEEDSYTYLCCFSKNSDSLAMWNYYSKSSHYSGYALGIARSHLVFRDVVNVPYKLYLKRVIYKEKEKFDLFDEYILPLLLFYDKEPESNKRMIVHTITKFLNEIQFVFKNQHFEHEEEIRAILRVPKRFTTDNFISERKYRENNGYIIPYVEVSLQRNDLRQITTAPLFEQDLAVKNLESMLEQKGFEKTKVVPSSIPIRF